jgi:putative copper export protein
VGARAAVLAAITFATGAAAFALLLLPTRRDDAAPGRSIAALITSFHPVALRCAALVLASGVGGLWLRVPHLGSLFGSSYGNAFLVKAGAAAAVACFGAWHARSAARRARSGDIEGLARSLATEAAFAALTILATAVLTGTEPPDAM